MRKELNLGKLIAGSKKAETLHTSSRLTHCSFLRNFLISHLPAVSLIYTLNG